MLTFESYKLTFVIKIIPIFISLILISLNSSGQEVIVPLQNNPQLNEQQNQLSKKGGLNKTRDTLQLPFFDDFTYDQVHPNQELWQNKQVFINNSYPIDPISYNVATFNGLNKFGNPYNASRKSSRGRADTLTSQHLDLSGLDASDSIYLSFFYQPKGYGDLPEDDDSLILEFKPIAIWQETFWDSSSWKRIWAASGGDGSKPFEQVMIPFNFSDSANMFYRGFQFRFVSYGNVSGNLDNWHLDYVFMDEGRSFDERNFQDVAMVKPPAGLLSRYQSMPWNQFIRNPNRELRNEFTFTARNLDEVPVRVDYGYNVINLNNNETVVNTFDQNFVEDIQANYALFDPAPFSNNINPNELSGDSLDLEINTAIGQASDNIGQNDTLTTLLHFHDYLAYDDGTAEAGYGLELDERGFVEGKMALRFDVNEEDSLRAVGMSFNRSRNDIRDRSFNLKVWDQLGVNASNSDEEVIATEKDLSVEYGFHPNNNFTIYKLDTPVAVNGIFYIGWQQFEPYILNIGYDQNYQEFNRDSLNSNLFINLGDQWQQTKTGGTPMIRPFISKSPIENYPQNVEAIEPKTFEPVVYPNPTHRSFAIKGLNSRSVELILMNMNGKTVLQKTYHQGNSINTSDLEPGIYFVQIRNKAAVTTKKLMIQR